MFAEAIRRLSEKTNIDLKKFVLKDEKNSHDPNECVLANFCFMQEDIFGAWEFFVNHKIPARTVQDSAV